MKGYSIIVGIVLLAGAVSEARAGKFDGPTYLHCLNQRLAGYVVDYTNNHGCDRRFWSPSLCKPRDVYVYLPPGFDPEHRYPVMFWFHGIGQDEHAFIDRLVELFDQAIVRGELPPLIIVAPDGSIDGRASMLYAGSFYLNSKAGRFEDYIICDLWPFILQNYPIRPEREAHVLAGASMGGFAAYNLGIKYRECFSITIGIFPPLNLRWQDCKGRYRGNFDPCCWGWMDKLKPLQPIARFCGGLITLRMKHITGPLFGNRQGAVNEISQENPIEMLEAYNVCPGQLAMYIGYGGKDEYNIDAQIDSFLYVARQRDLDIEVEFLPDGRHDTRTGVKLFPGVIHWLAPRLAPYCPLSGDDTPANPAPRPE
ncbi:MAG: alpha/beta hydrolase [Gemmataceae bacterium]